MFSCLLFYELLLRLAPGQHYLTHERIRKQYDGGRIVVNASLSLRGERQRDNVYHILCRQRPYLQNEALYKYRCVEGRLNPQAGRHISTI